LTGVRVNTHEPHRCERIQDLQEHIVRLNEASWDRVVRVILGVVLIGAGLIGVAGPFGWALAAVGLVLVVTGIVGWCPIYAGLGIGTKKSDVPSEMSEGGTAA
jgi:hypothetical protein